MYGRTVHNGANEGGVMRLLRIKHKGLRQLYAEDDPKGLSKDLVDKLRKLLFAIETAHEIDQIGHFPGWRLHALKGDLRGFWSLTVSGNWRLIFRYDEPSNTVSDVDLIDYH